MNTLDSLSFPLQGASLIEASAGTGKTYTIVNLYLRLLLGHQCDALTVDKILVVTFTKAATAELKDRVRRRIHQAYLAFYGSKSSDPFLQDLIVDLADSKTACERLSLAAKQMDEAAIFTIHSFCQRMLTQYAFESGASFEEHFEADETPWLVLAVQDYWRSHIASQPRMILQQILKIWSTPEQLLNAIWPLVHRAFSAQNIVTVAQALVVHEQWQHEVEALKAWWMQQKLSQRLSQAKLNQRSKIAKQDTHRVMDEFCVSSNLDSPFEKTGWSDFYPEKIEKAATKSSLDLSDIDFSRFERVDEFANRVKNSFAEAFYQHALQEVRDNLQRHKKTLNLLAPDDLLSRLSVALHSDSGQLLANVISQAYPAALIDEFQDTDPTQFDVFSQIYAQAKTDSNGCLIMIGDPKQAIYGFRGADIFTYIQAKRQVVPEQQFTLSTNWRTQSLLVKSINQVFAVSEQGFIFRQDIPFVQAEAAKQEVQIVINGESRRALECMHLIDQAPCIGNPQARDSLSVHFANHLVNVLSDGQIRHIEEGNVVLRKIIAGDCCVLVRDRTEASAIKQALANANIASVFLARHSVFSTDSAVDLYLLLSGLANPSDERKLRAAFSTSTFCLQAHKLDELFGNETVWQDLLDNCFVWQKVWQKQGIMLAINQALHYFDVFNRLLDSYSDGLRRVTDLRHLIDLLQQQSAITPGENQLLQWFNQHIQEPDHNNENQQLRLETEDNLVKIVTMHASKGLEFPLVFMPFGCAMRRAKNGVYHDQTQQLAVDFSGDSDALEQADFERLAEDTRLLYVALTRAQYYCCIGVWNPCEGNRKTTSVLKQTAIGRLLLRANDEPDNAQLAARLIELSQQIDLGYYAVDTQVQTLQYSAGEQTHSDHWQAAVLSRSVNRTWQLTSYSAIARDQLHPEHETPGRDEQESLLPSEINDPQDEQLTRFNFTKGAQAGLFLHGVLEHIEFTQPDNLANVVAQQATLYGIDEKWQQTVETWMLDVLKTPIINRQKTHSRLTLGQLASSQMRVEMEFHVPMEHVNEVDFNRVINHFFKTGHRQYQFGKLNGMLKGFIDLTLEHDGKYYVVDYKSNYLGNDFADYRQANMQAAMIEHDYQLQALIYVLALHRFLRLHVPDYHYDTHIGGAYYLFLRGMTAALPENGCYYLLPSSVCIDTLDNLFSGDKVVLPPEDGTFGRQMDLC